MAHNAYIRIGGVWNALTVLTSAEMAAFDLRQFQAVNGDLGGTWTPAAAIVIGAPGGLSVTGPFVAADADITITSGKKLTVNSGGEIDAKSTSTVNLKGTTNVTATGTMHVLTGGGKIVVDSGGALEVFGAAALTMKAGSQSVQETTAFLTLSGTTQLVSGTIIGTGAAHVTLVSGDVLANAGATNLTGVQTLAGTVNTIHGSTSNSILGVTDIGNTLHVDAACTFRSMSSLVAVADAPFTLANVVTCTNQLVVDGGLLGVVGGTVTLDATTEVTREGPLVLSGATATTSPRMDYAPNVSDAFDPSLQDYWEVPVISGNTIYDLTVPARRGVYMFTQSLNVDPTYTVTIRRASDSLPLATFLPTKQSWALIKYDGSVLSTAAFGGDP